MLHHLLFFAEAPAIDFDRRVLLVFPALVLPFLLPALVWRAFPTRRTLMLLVIPALFSPTLFIFRDLTLQLVFAVIPLAVIDLLIVLLLAFDFFSSLPLFRKPFAIARQHEKIASLSRPNMIRLRIENHARRAFRVTVRDDLAPTFRTETEFFAERLLPGRSAETLEYEIEPQERGLFTLEETAVRIRSRFGLWLRDITIPCKTELHVYPNLRQINEYDLLARSDRLHQLGVRVARRVGQDNDFERLRDYQPDDQYKFIDWTATARRRKLTVRDFQASRSQRLMFLVDCGRMMTNLSGDGLTLLDHSLNAALMLGYVALRRFDAVGTLCFSNRIINYIPAGSGERQMNRLLHGFFNLQPEPVESRYDEAFAYLAAKCRKRSLVILITNVADQVNAWALQSHLTYLCGRHLPLGVFLRDHQIFDPVSNFFDSHADAFQPVMENETTTDRPTGQNAPDMQAFFAKNRNFWRAGAAADIINWRHKVINDLKHQGTLTLDLFPENMTAPLINKYLEVKARHLL
ncbi:MAG: DUF58 domain-containing protein [Planctomycetaceae bacterium]|nr:DUF58 domain-containing protein [Planctomycetaceae bacterium]